MKSKATRTRIKTAAALLALAAFAAVYFVLSDNRIAKTPQDEALYVDVQEGPLVLNSDYGLGRAQADLASGLADAISFGRPFLANPDLVDRLRDGAPLTQAQMATFYSQGAEGYTDYPTLAEEKAAA